MMGRGTSGMIKRYASAGLILAAAAHGQTSKHAASRPPPPMHVDPWATLAPPPTLIAPPRPLNMAPPTGRAEQVTVYAHPHPRDAEWRAELAGKAPAYEAANADAAQPSFGFYPRYTSADQQRLMSEKSELLGICGALGGYIQCPNPPP